MGVFLGGFGGWITWRTSPDFVRARQLLQDAQRPLVEFDIQVMHPLPDWLFIGVGASVGLVAGIIVAIYDHFRSRSGVMDD